MGGHSFDDLPWVIYLGVALAGCRIPLQGRDQVAYRSVVGREGLEDDKDGKWLAINSKFAESWRNITLRKDAPADADAMAEETGKFEKYFSEKPGTGD